MVSGILSLVEQRIMAWGDWESGPGAESVGKSKVCQSCERVFAYFYEKDTKRTAAIISDVLVFICKAFKIEQPEVCSSVVPPEIAIALEQIHKHYLDPKRICPRLLLCKKSYRAISIKKTVQQILSDKPAKKKPIPQMESTYNLLQITDIHVDLAYKPGYNMYCKEPDCCRDNHSKEKVKQFSPAGYWGSLAVCNIPLWTIDQMVRFIKNNLSVDLAIWTGDNFGHNVWELTQETAREATLAITSALKNLSPTKVVPVIGNHDSFPINNFDFRGDAEDYIKVPFAEAWRDWIGQGPASEFRNKSFYSYYDYDLDVKIIAMNTQVAIRPRTAGTSPARAALRMPRNKSHIARLAIHHTSHATQYIVLHTSHALQYITLHRPHFTRHTSHATLHTPHFAHIGCLCRSPNRLCPLFSSQRWSGAFRPPPCFQEWRS